MKPTRAGQEARVRRVKILVAYRARRWRREGTLMCCAHTHPPAAADTCREAGLLGNAGQALRTEHIIRFPSPRGATDRFRPLCRIRWRRRVPLSCWGHHGTCTLVAVTVIIVDRKRVGDGLPVVQHPVLLVGAAARVVVLGIAHAPGAGPQAADAAEAGPAAVAGAALPLRAAAAAPGVVRAGAGHRGVEVAAAAHVLPSGF